MPRKKRKPVRSSNTDESWSFANTSFAETEESAGSAPPEKKPKKEVIYTIMKVKSNDEKYFLRKFMIGVTNNVLPVIWKKCKVICSEKYLILSFDNHEQIVINLCCSYENKFLFDLFSMKMLSFNFCSIVEKTTVEIEVMLYLCESQLSVKSGKILQELMVMWFSIDMSDVYEEEVNKDGENVEELYNDIKNYRNENYNTKSETDVQHPSLLLNLRPYQKDAVHWMIQREKIMSQTDNVVEDINLLYTTVTLNSDTKVYYNKYLNCVDVNKPLVKYVNTGGILADEMGLGKTIEVLACILNNPRPVDDYYQENEEIDDGCSMETVNGSINDSCSNDTSIPVIKRQIKHVKSKKSKIKKETETNKPKKLYSKAVEKLTTKKAAQIWYENKLAEMVIKNKNKVIDVVKAQCICGDFSTTGTVTCRECNKIQHPLCLGYKKIDDNYICPQCWVHQPLIKSKTTLIVSPAAISRQWSLEVQRHIRQNGLKILEYRGIQQGGVLYPTDLTTYDMVITTYNVLQNEIRFSTAEDGVDIAELRYAKRYHSPVSPLRRIEWWRLCLDEAQFVECPSTLIASMAKTLNAVHRWAITGTPIQKQFSDLFGLINYLQISPYDDTNVWYYVLYYPYIHGNKKPLVEFLTKIMWRSSKVDVLGQINIPVQTTEEHSLEFSAVEKYFYNREHESCAIDFLKKLTRFESFDIAIKSIDKRILRNILTPLLSLRHACSHPYAVRGRYLTTKKQVNSMEELLDVLIKKNVNDCEETLRAIIASLNGMAGILLLQYRVMDAVEKYREALSYMSEYDKKGFLKIDKLQRIHTLHNLNDVIKDNSLPSPLPTLRDDQLAQECEMYESRYMARFINETRTALQEISETTNVVKQRYKDLKSKEGVCFVELIEWLVEENCEKEVCIRVEQVSSEIGLRNKYHVISSSRTLNYIITTWIDKITNQLLSLRKSFKLIEDVCNSEENKYYISDEIVEKAMDCHLRPGGKNKKPKHNCMCCVLDSKLKKYECMIFQMNVKNNKNESNKGSWQPCFEEKVLKAVYSYAKSRGASAELVNEGMIHLKLCEARRKEFKALRKLYTYFDAQVSAQDELNICKIRFRLRRPDEPVKVIQKKISMLDNLNYEVENKYEFIHVMSEFELDMSFNLLKDEKATNEEKLKKILGTHNYLETLRNQQYEGKSPDPCPICCNQLTQSWSILQCGHCYCLDCIHTLLKQWKSAARVVQCCVCRKKQKLNDISYIKIKNSLEKSIDDINIKGSYSTKLQAVISLTLKLKQADPNVKILIFSTWNEILKALCEAFYKNDIRHEYVTTSNLQDKLQKFKEYDITALLLPIRLGANGLNLTEATHVFLIEPVMNPGEELQAIGRVHRIGQTKPTFVHRFIIKNTVEEKIHVAMSTNTQQWEENSITLNELKCLFTDVDTCVKENSTHDQ